MHLVTEIAQNSGALYARNRYNMDFADRIAFFDVDDAKRTLSGDRTEFIGRNATLENPAAMTRARLSGKVGPLWIPAPRSRFLLSWPTGKSVTSSSGSA